MQLRFYTGHRTQMSRIATRERNNGEREQGSLMHKCGRGKGEGEGKGTNRVWNKGS